MTSTEFARETLTEVVSVSQRLSAAVMHSNAKRIENTDVYRARLSRDLQRIVVASETILTTLNKSLLSESTLDDRLQDWLSGKEPVTCLNTLQQMEKLLQTDSDRRGRGVFQQPDVFSSMPTQDGINDTITVFDKQKGSFHFLLATDVWNCELTSTERERREVRVTSSARQHTKPDTQKKPNKPEEKVYSEKLDTLRQWLDAFDCAQKHEETFSLRQPGTCTWLHRMKTYKTWRREEETFLWLQGKAGAGKSVLAASVIEDLKASIQDDEHVAFFYCDFRDERSTSAAEAMRSLLSQLLRKLRESTGRGPTTLVKDLIPEKDGSSILKNATCLAHFVSRVAKEFSRQPLFVIDAVDECKDIESLLSALCQLSKDGMRLFVTSRPLQVIKDSLVGVVSISMDRMPKAISADIRLHVIRELDGHKRLRILTVKLKKNICSTLQSKADGVFRWVQCQINTLKECVTTREIEKALDTLPIGLEATYARILYAIDQRRSEGKLAQRALTWLVAALRPLKLTEMVEVLSVDLDRQMLDRDIGPVHGAALLDALSSLVIYDEGTGVVILSHFSVKEYLMGELARTTLSAYHVELQKSHVQVSRLCMCYIAASLKHQRAPSNKHGPHSTIRNGVSSRSRPLLDYIFAYGFNHLTYLDPFDNEVLDAMIALRSDIRRYHSEWEHMCTLASTHSRYKSWLAPKRDFVIGVLVVLLPEQFLGALFDRIRSKARDGPDMLIYATHFCKIEHVKSLLARRVNVNASGWDVNRSRRVSPLEVALVQGHRVLVDLFLMNWNATVPQKLLSDVFDGQHCPYQPALVARLVQTDEFIEWAADVDDRLHLLRMLDQDRYGRYRMTQKYLLVMLRRLVQLGCDLAATVAFGHILRALAWATSKGYVTVLEYLLSLDVPMPSRVLFSEGTAKLVQHLRCQGIDVGAVAAKGDALLHHVLGCCMSGSRCWALGCKPCSAFRFASTQDENEIDIHFFGKSGVGKSSLVDMIMGIPNCAAQISNSLDASTKETNCYLALLGTGSRCRLWDTQGISDGHPCSELIDRVCQLSTKSPLSPIVVWCMDASDLGNPLSWKQARSTYMECYRRRVKPMVVITRANPDSAADWEGKCKNQLPHLYLEEEYDEEEPDFIMGRVRNHLGVTSPEYKEDSLALRDVIYRCARCPLVNSDMGAMFISEYSDEIFEYMSILEDDVKPDPDYIDKQTHFTWHQRETLADWLIQVHFKLLLLPETLWITINIVDRFLARRVVSLKKLRLVGVTAMFIAAKYEEGFAPPVDEIVSMTPNGYSADAIIRGERIVLRQLDYKISHYCAPYAWLRKISVADDFKGQTRMLSKFLAEVTLFERHFLGYNPSHVAAVAMYSARTMLRSDWDAAFAYHSGFAAESLETGHNWICRKLLEDDFPTRYVYKKYSRKKFLEVSVFALQWAKVNSSEELEFEGDLESDGEMDSQSESELEGDSESDGEMGQSGSGLEEDSESDEGMDSPSGSELESDSESDRRTDSQSGSELEGDSESDRRTDSQSGSELEGDSESDRRTDSQSGSELESDSESDG